MAVLKVCSTEILRRANIGRLHPIRKSAAPFVAAFSAANTSLRSIFFAACAYIVMSARLFSPHEKCPAVKHGGHEKSTRDVRKCSVI